MVSTFYAVGSFAVVVFLVQKIVNYVRVERFKKKHGCKPAKKLPQTERIIGYDFYRIQMNASKNKKILEVGRARYINNGNTWSKCMMGKEFFNVSPRGIFPSPFRVFKVTKW